MRTPLVLVAAVTLTASLLASGCKGGKKKADCNAAASNYATLLREQIERDSTTDEKQKEQALSLMSQLKEDMAKSCEAQKWNETIRDCIANAKAQADLERCMPKKEAGDKAPPEPPKDEAKTP